VIVPLPFYVPERVMEKVVSWWSSTAVSTTRVARSINGNNQAFLKKQRSSQVLKWQNLLEHSQTSILALRCLYEEQA
jgi:hypothetical protein